MYETTTINDLLRQITHDLQVIAHNPRQEAELILSHVLKSERIYLYSHHEHKLTAEEIAVCRSLIQRRLAGEPLAYILEEWEFWSLKLLINRQVLIPRPETELLVEVALKLLDANESLKIADLGTGSGAIALALATERPGWTVVATDKSAAALWLAQENAQRLAVKNIEFFKGDWCKAFSNNKLDAIISNPPYVAENDPALEEGVKLYEPETALVAGVDGLDALRIIIADASEKLVAGGWLMLEHGYNQGNAVRELMQQQDFTEITCFKDFSGHDRITIGRKNDKLK